MRAVSIFENRYQLFMLTDDGKIDRLTKAIGRASLAISNEIPQTAPISGRLKKTDLNSILAHPHLV